MGTVHEQGANKSPTPKAAPASPPSFNFALPDFGGSASPPAVPDVKTSETPALPEIKAPDLPNFSMPFKVLACHAGQKSLQTIVVNCTRAAEAANTMALNVAASGQMCGCLSKNRYHLRKLHVSSASSIRGMLM